MKLATVYGILILHLLRPYRGRAKSCKLGFDVVGLLVKPCIFRNYNRWICCVMMNLSLKRVGAWTVPVSKWYQTGAFVSEHFVPPVEEFKSVLNALDTPTRPGGTPGTTVLKVCRLCSKENKDVMSNHWKLTIRENGSYYCFRCSHGMELMLRT
jgi:hypothetical protein